MTVETNWYRSGKEASYAYCLTCDPGKKSPLASISNGVGHDAEPLTQPEIDFIEEAAKAHDQIHRFVNHKIIVFHFGRNN